MTRTLVVTNDFPTRRGGIETFVLSLCQQLPADEVVVYTAAMPGGPSYDATLAFPVHRDPTSMLLPTPRVGARVERVLRETGCDRVLFGASAPLGLLAGRLRAAGAERVVALTHGHEVWWARAPGARQVLRRIGEGCDVLTYVSAWCRDRIAPALSPAAAARMQRLSPGVDTGAVPPRLRRRRCPPPLGDRARCAGRGVHRTDGAPQGPGPAARGVAARAGRGTGRPAAARRRRTTTARRCTDGVRATGCARSVVFTGSVPWSEMPAHTDAGDVFAMPCRTRLGGLEPEAFGIVALEAAACGLPVVIGDSGGAPETVLDGETGLRGAPAGHGGRGGATWWRCSRAPRAREPWASAAATGSYRTGPGSGPARCCAPCWRRAEAAGAVSSWRAAAVARDRLAGGLEQRVSDHAAESEDDQHDQRCDAGHQQPVLDCGRACPRRVDCCMVAPRAIDGADGGTTPWAWTRLGPRPPMCLDRP